MTLRDIKRALAPDITVTRRDGEYRVNFRHGLEVTAYYTTDLADAFDTGQAMRTWLANKIASHA